MIEYEFAPADRLGLEIEIPLSVYFDSEKNETTPKSKINSLKLATQYTFLVAEKINMSMDIEYIHEFKMTDFKSYGKENLFTGNIYNPFLIVAKNWKKTSIHSFTPDLKFSTYLRINHLKPAGW